MQRSFLVCISPPASGPFPLHQATTKGRRSPQLYSEDGVRWGAQRQLDFPHGGGKQHHTMCYSGSLRSGG